MLPDKHRVVWTEILAQDLYSTNSADNEDQHFLCENVADMKSKLLISYYHITIQQPIAL